MCWEYCQTASATTSGAFPVDRAEHLEATLLAVYESVLLRRVVLVRSPDAAARTFDRSRQTGFHVLLGRPAFPIGGESQVSVGNEKNFLGHSVGFNLDCPHYPESSQPGAPALRRSCRAACFRAAIASIQSRRLSGMHPLADHPRGGGLRRRLHHIIFGVRTPAAKAFDVALLVVILLSVLTVMLESVPSINASHGKLLRAAEWSITVIFTVEYALRLWTVGHARSYALSFFGIVDLLAILPTYLSALAAGSQSLAVVRGIRLLRVFRVLKLVRHMGEARAPAHGAVCQPSQDRRLPRGRPSSSQHLRDCHVPGRG